jgi:tRNA pseudouridine38-40 synthase
MRTLKLTVEYDGTNYVGWQRQAAGTSIQGLLEGALARIEGRAVAVHGAGRTDAGVHALGQVASVELRTGLPEGTLTRALNAVLPPDVRVRLVQAADVSFHARFSARSKTYEYRLVNAPVISAFLYRYAWHVSHAVDTAAMREAAAWLVGTHDFAAFQASGSAVATTARTVHALVIEEGADRDRPLVIRVTGDGFLRHMVRTIVGTLIEVGSARREPASMRSTLLSRDRAQAGATAPAHGLFLTQVEY